MTSRQPRATRRPLLRAPARRGGDGMLRPCATRPLDTSDQKRTPIALIAMSIALNQSSIMFGVNASLADPLALLLLVGAALSSGLRVPLRALLFFLTVAFVTLATAIVLTPNWIGTPTPLIAMVRDFIKLVLSFCYFLLGYHIVRTRQAAVVLRSFAIAGAAVSSLALVSLAVPALQDSEQLYYSGVRFRGLMNDPNYFAVLAVAALAILWRDKELAPGLRVIGSVSLFGGLLLSGSKTGLLTLCALLLWRVSMYIVAGDGFRSPPRILATTLGAALIMFAMATIINPDTATYVASHLEGTPPLNRLVPLLSDLDEAVSASGSGRDSAWATATTLIAMSPLSGVGLGSYSHLAEAITGSPVLAHNTALQLSAEWGLPLTALLFTWLIFLMFATLGNRSQRIHGLRSGRDALFVMLVGSMGVSLNNARPFWLLLGIVAGAVSLLESRSSVSKSQVQPVVDSGQ